MQLHFPAVVLRPTAVWRRWHISHVLLVTLSVVGSGFCTAASAEFKVDLAATLEGYGGDFSRFSDDGGRLLTIGGDTARVWSIPSCKPLTTPLNHGADIEDAGWASAGERLFTAGGKQVRIWESHKGKVATTLSQDFPVKPTSVTADGNFVVAGNSPGAGAVWDVRSGKVLYQLEGPQPGREDTRYDDAQGP